MITRIVSSDFTAANFGVYSGFGLSQNKNKKILSYFYCDEMNEFFRNLRTEGVLFLFFLENQANKIGSPIISLSFARGSSLMYLMFRIIGKNQPITAVSRYGEQQFLQPFRGRRKPSFEFRVIDL